MIDPTIIELLHALAWPAVGLIFLIHIWRTKFLNSIIGLPTTISELKAIVAELKKADAELGETTLRVASITKDVTTIKDEIEAFGFQIDQLRKEFLVSPNAETKAESIDGTQQAKLSPMYDQIENAWKGLEGLLKARFGWDGRSIGGAALSTAEDENSGLSPELAANIADLHSKMKSYRRRQSNLPSWLTQKLRDDFLNSVTRIKKQFLHT